MSRGTRTVVFGVAAAVFATLLFWGLAGLPDFGSYQGGYGNQLNREVVPERHTTNVVGAVVFDYRGLDTLGEEFILFTAVLGVVLLLRERRETKKEEEEKVDIGDEIESDAIRLIGVAMISPAFLLGLWLVAFGYVTPGGGFQGGVVLAGAILLAFLAGSFRRFHEVAPGHAVELVEGIGAGGYALIGVAGLIVMGAFLQNFLGRGVTGSLYSGGSIPFLNWASAMEVSAATIVLFSEFLEEYAAPVAGGRL
jgi:multicomponent Na+:H+ antiporter subunit B